MCTGRAGRSYLCEVMGSYKGKMKQCVKLLIITVLLYILGLLAYWSQQAPVLVKCPRWGLPKAGNGWTRLSKHTFNKETVYIFLPSNIQQPMCSAECLMGNRAFKDTAKRPCLNVIWSLDELMIHTHSRHPLCWPTNAKYTNVWWEIWWHFKWLTYNDMEWC